MGLLNDLKRAVAESPGRVLLTELQRKTAALKGADSSVLAAATAGFIELRSTALSEMRNMTPQGRIKLAVDFQRAGSKKFDLDMSGGFAVWAVGAWLEAGERPGHEAADVYQSLEALAELYYSEYSGPGSPLSPAIGTTQESDCDIERDQLRLNASGHQASVVASTIESSQHVGKFSAAYKPIDDGRFRTSQEEKAMLKSRFEKSFPPTKVL